MSKSTRSVAFEQYVCCSNCFSLYDAELAPEECGYQVSLATQPCGADLFHPHRIIQRDQIDIFKKVLKPQRPRWVHGQILLCHTPRPRIPKSTFITQSLTDWLKWFLNVLDVEEIIETWQHQLEFQPQEPILNVAQGPMWSMLFPKETIHHRWHLGFSLFIDWYNPLQNKLAGGQVSMGLIALNCLNLPPQLGYQTKYTFLSGIIPRPKQPNTVTINNILKPLVNELLELSRGITICTPKYPRGCKVVVKLASLIGDVVATHKAGGFMSHSAKRFCNWCEIESSGQRDLKLGRQRHG
ncbi:hypothetical protein O181_121890 [Austropuccinia psidii MF-1]|uniref:Transposase n=1 Tax=Austropuccinia psidii MF-1 TaxID=1389203 RepID=A0A9Q3KN40_9BASI|nr:hypothetical protein [Austropuccinia psidii MF-1]